jgi:hypothetical protein
MVFSSQWKSFLYGCKANPFFNLISLFLEDNKFLSYNRMIVNASSSLVPINIRTRKVTGHARGYSNQ